MTELTMSTSDLERIREQLTRISDAQDEIAEAIDAIVEIIAVEQPPSTPPQEAAPTQRTSHA